MRLVNDVPFSDEEQWAIGLPHNGFNNLNPILRWVMHRGPWWYKISWDVAITTNYWLH